MASPENKSHEYTKDDNIIIDSYFVHKGNEHFEQAYVILKPLEKKYPDDFLILFLLGISLFESKSFEKSIPYLEKSTTLNPSHYVASLTLIHSLINSNRWNRALKELRRFLIQKKEIKEHVLFLQLLDEGQEVFGSSERHTIQKMIEEFGIKKRRNI